MGKRRNTAKTGDKGLYKSRASLNDDAPKNEDDEDPMYDEVDRFHNEKDKDFLKLDNDGEDSADDDDTVEEAVMDLGVGGDNSSSEDADSSDEGSVQDDGSEAGDGEAALSSSDDDDNDDEELEENVRDWGRKKSAYYHGDTADLEIGQDEDDAFLEEEAAKEVQAARFKDMTEEDFVLSDDEEDAVELRDGKGVTATRNLSKLSMKDKQKLLDKQHPELLPLLSHFSTMVEHLDAKTAVATRAVFFGEEDTADSIGATKLGQQYLLTKALLQSSAALNLAMYLLLKAEQAEADDTVDPGLIQSHPVMLHLQKLNSLTQNLEDGVENKATGLREQLDNLVKAAALLGSSDAASNSDNDSDDNADESSESVDIPAQTVEESKKRPTSVSKNDESASSESEPADSSEDEATASRTVLTEARFGLRRSEVANEKSKRKRRRPMIYDAGDDDVEATQQKNISHSLATTLNAIEQRSETRKKRSAPLAEHLDEHEDDDGELRRGLEMMEAELGKASDEDELGDGHDDPELDDDEVGDDFYSQVSKKSKSRKEFKKNLYRVAPKFPRIEGEIDGERAISQQILKNRGLVAHKAKINRNPRVKKREQYRKAIIRRKGAVRDVRTDEGHKYGGEETGIKTNLSKSRKLAR